MSTFILSCLLMLQLHSGTIPVKSDSLIAPEVNILIEEDPGFIGTPEDAINAAKADIEAGNIRMYKLGHPHNMESDKLMNEIAGLYGYKYQYLAPTVEDGMSEYVSAYNEEQRKYLATKFGDNWEECLADYQNRIGFDKKVAAMGLDKVKENYITSQFELYFEANSSKLQEAETNRIVVLAANLANQKDLVRRVPDMYKGKRPENYKILINPYHVDGESKELMDKRAGSAKKALLAAGVSSDNIQIGKTLVSTDNCKNCPYDRSSFKYKILLKIDYVENK